MTQDIISIIIPVLNEAAIVRQTLIGLQQHTGVEIIVVDGGSRDNTVAIARQIRLEERVIIVVPNKGRAAQMNAGADLARGNFLLFLHVDTQLPPDFVAVVRETLNQPKVVAGAFELAIEGQEKSLRWVEMLVNLRSRLLSLPYGDQAIFVSRQAFTEVGGFANLPIMEDFEFIKRIKRTGKIAIAPAKVITSSRRWQKLGVWKTTLINQLIIAGYYLGISPAKLSNFYRSRGK